MWLEGGGLVEGGCFGGFLGGLLEDGLEADGFSFSSAFVWRLSD